MSELFHKEPGVPYLQVIMTEPELLETLKVLEFSMAAYRFLSEDALKKDDKLLALDYATKAEQAKQVYSRFTALAEIGRPVNDIPH